MENVVAFAGGRQSETVSDGPYAFNELKGSSVTGLELRATSRSRSMLAVEPNLVVPCILHGSASCAVLLLHILHPGCVTLCSIAELPEKLSH